MSKCPCETVCGEDECYCTKQSTLWTKLSAVTKERDELKAELKSVKLTRHEDAQNVNEPLRDKISELHAKLATAREAINAALKGFPSDDHNCECEECRSYRLLKATLVAIDGEKAKEEA